MSMGAIGAQGLLGDGKLMLEDEDALETPGCDISLFLQGPQTFFIFLFGN